MGPDALREVIENAELYPIKGLFNFKDYFDEINDYYHQSLGFDLGVSTGWRALNELYNVSMIAVVGLQHFNHIFATFVT